MRAKNGSGRLIIGASIVAALLLTTAADAGGKRRGKPAKPGGAQIQVPSTLEDFFQPGTQPDPTGTVVSPILSSQNCVFCHGEYLDSGTFEEPWDGWVGSLMAQSARDPVWYAALAVANQDANMSGEYCIRCHSPTAWLGGRSVPPDASGFVDSGSSNDFDGVTCHFCHRSVNPVFESDSPIEDAAILANLAFPPGTGRGNGRYVVDPDDVRRGPYEDVATNPGMNMHGVPVLFSPFHRRSEACATCHDVMNPMFMKQPDGSYALTPLGAEHPTQDPYDMFPEQTTYSEWQFSQFANGGVLFDDGRFGGNHPTGVMAECQDCHMPDQEAGGCFAWEFPPFAERTDLPAHTLTGGNTWVLAAIRELYFDSETGLSAETVTAARDRTEAFLRAGSDLEVQQYGDELKVRIVNWAGHKLPTGYPEGRRIWINVRFLDEFGDDLLEHGAYDWSTGVLATGDTKVYEAIHVISDEVAAATNLPPDTEFHLALNSKILKDNRIPPVGFTNAAYEMFGSAPVGATYADGQHWDDTVFTIPPGAADAIVTVYFQSATKEYMEFLRDANQTNAAGQTIYDLWADPLVGNRAAPTDLDAVAVALNSPLIGDIDGDGTVGFSDLVAVLAAWGPCPPPSLCAHDLDCDGSIGFSDLLIVLANWTF